MGYFSTVLGPNLRSPGTSRRRRCEAAGRRIVESDLAGPLHIEAAGGALVGRVDLLEAALQMLVMLLK